MAPTARSSSDEALQRLVSDGTLTAEQADAVRAALVASAQPATAWRAWLAEAAGYVGGALVLAGGVLLVGTSWDELSRPGRVLVLVAATVLLAAAGAVAGGGAALLRRSPVARTSARRRIASVLFVLAAGTGALAAGVAVPDHGLIVGGAAGLAIAALAYLLVPSLPALLATAVFSGITGASIVDDLAGATPLWIGLTLIVIGAGWAALGLSGVLVHRAGALVIGAVLALFGAQQPVGDNQTAGWAYGLTLLVALACFAGYALEHNLLLLIAGVAGTTLAAVEAVADWTDGAVAGAAIVIVAGAALLLISVVAMRARTDHHPRARRE